MRYFFFYWYRSEQHGGCNVAMDNHQHRKVITVEMTHAEAMRLRDMRDEIDAAVDSDLRPHHQASLRTVYFSQSALAFNRRDQRIHPLLLAWALELDGRRSESSVSRMASRIRNRIQDLTSTSLYDFYGFADENWTLIPTRESRLLPFNMRLCDFSFVSGGIQIISQFGVTMPLPWTAIKRLEDMAPHGNPLAQEKPKIKRRTVLVGR